MYVNGTLIDTQAYIEASEFNGDLFFGLDNLGGLTRFNGTIEDFRLWNVTRTLEEIAENRDNMVGPDETGSFLNYRFDQSGTQNILSSFSNANAYLPGQLFNFDNNGTTSGWVTSDAFAPAATGNQNALNFDGVDDYVDLGTPAELNFGVSDFTIETWINVPAATDLTDSPVIAMKGDAGASANGFDISVDPTGLVIVRISDGVLLTSVSSVDITVNDGTWHHVAFTREGDSGSLYIDGLLITSELISTLDITTTDDFLIGSRNSTAGFFAGSMDEFKIWNAALTIEEIRSHINVELDPMAVGNLVSYYRFNEGEPGVDNSLFISINDENGNNTGFLRGFALSGVNSNFILSDLFDQFVPTLSASLIGGGELIHNSTTELGVILEGDSISSQIVLTNIGLADLNINSIDLPAGFTLERDLADLILTPFESDTVEIKFISTTSGIQSDIFSVDSDNSQGVFRVTLEVNVYPDLAVAGNAIRFNGKLQSL